MTIPFADDVAASLTLSPATSACDHLAVQYTLTIGARSVTRTIHVNRDDLRQRAMTAEEADAFAEFSLRVIAEQVAKANLRTAMSTKVVDLTAVG